MHGLRGMVRWGFRFGFCVWMGSLVEGCGFVVVELYLRSFFFLMTKVKEQMLILMMGSICVSQRPLHI